MTLSTPASPTSSEADSECLDDGSSSPCSFTGEECPDLCGGPKHSCRSWTPPASPFYYTDQGGIFLVDDRHKFEERQKTELDHTLRDLDARLQRLEATMSPPKFLSQLGEIESPMSSPLGGKAPKPSEGFLPSPTEGFAEHSRNTSTSLKQYPFVRDDTLSPCRLCPTGDTSTEDTVNIQAKGENRTTNLGKRTYNNSLQYVQSTNSLPQHPANKSETEAQSVVPREQAVMPNSPKGPPPPHDGTFFSTKPAASSPQLHHFGNTAYPTPLPSSPETKPSRKRRLDECPPQGSGSSVRKRRRGEGGGGGDEWVSTLWKIFND